MGTPAYCGHALVDISRMGKRFYRIIKVKKKSAIHKDEENRQSEKAD